VPPPLGCASEHSLYVLTIARADAACHFGHVCLQPWTRVNETGPKIIINDAINCSQHFGIISTALEMASSGNQQVPIVSAHFRSLVCRHR